MPRDKLFRKVALDRLAAPEQLDLAVAVISPRLWIAWGTLTIAAIAVIVWALLGEVTTRVSASGILLVKGGQVLGALAPVNGTLERLDVGVGDWVDRGQVLANIAQPQTIERLRGAETLLNKRRHVDKETRAAIEKENSIHMQNVERSRRRLQNIIDLARSKVATTRQRQMDNQKLLEDGIISRAEMERRNEEHDQARRQLLDAMTRLDGIESREVARRNQASARLNESLDRVVQAERQFDEIQASLAIARVLAPAAGRVTEIMEHAGAIVRTGAPIVSIESDGTGIEVLAYIPPDIGKRVEVGMAALVSPVTVKREEAGSVKGEVVMVSNFPVTSKGIVAVLQNQDLAEIFTLEGPPYAARIRLETDTSNASGYRWTSPKADHIALTSGTLVSVEVTEKVQAPIELVVPLLRETFGL